MSLIIKASQIRQIQTSTDLTSELTKKPKADDSTPRKSAFDILEEQVSRSQIKEQMKQASESGFINQFIDPSVVGEILEGLNIPDEQEDEDFQMIDLDTGLPVEEEEIEVEVELEAGSLDEFDQKDELVESLDKAFEKFKEIKEAQVVENIEGVEAPPVPTEETESPTDDDLSVVINTPYFDFRLKLGNKNENLTNCREVDHVKRSCTSTKTHR